MDKKVIILNKIFQGSWNKEEGNISHEIIDFFKTDKGEHYIYNDPWGHCPSYIYVGKKDNDKRTHEVKYILLTGTGTRDFELLYLIELEEVLQHYSTGKTIKKSREKITEIIKRNEIIYGGVPLDQIYGEEDESLLVTFKASGIYTPKRKLTSKLPIKDKYGCGEGYIFQRNKGYIKSDEYLKDYDCILGVIEKKDGSINTDNWVKYELPSIDPTALITNNNQRHKTFLDMIYKSDSEECFTNMLYSILSQEDLLYQFCDEFKKNDQELHKGPFIVKREQAVENGRMDISGESKVDNTTCMQRVIIENKIWSGLNGIKKDSQEQISQLSTYYNKWGAEGKMDPICFIIAPDYRIDYVKREIDAFDPQMKDIYKIVPYGRIADFIERHSDQIYQYSTYVRDCVLAFRKHSYKNEQEFFTQLFAEAISNK